MHTICEVNVAINHYRWCHKSDIKDNADYNKHGSKMVLLYILYSFRHDNLSLTTDNLSKISNGREYWYCRCFYDLHFYHPIPCLFIFSFWLLRTVYYTVKHDHYCSQAHKLTAAVGTRDTTRIVA